MKKLHNKHDYFDSDNNLRAQPRKSGQKHHGHRHEDDEGEHHHGHHHEPGKNSVRMQMRSIQRLY